MPEPYYQDESVTLYRGKCEEVLPSLPEASIDACVTDPPYGLSELPRRQVEKALAAWLAGDRLHVPDGRGFMGAEWDKFVPPPGVWDEVYRVLKPGAYLLAFAAPRTYDLMGLSIRLAGFEVQDSIDWIFGQGWPKGRGRLKPAHEPCVVAWKPAKRATELPGLDACRVETTESLSGGAHSKNASERWDGDKSWRFKNGGAEYQQPDGRWPPNVVLTHSPRCEFLGTKRVKGITGSTGHHKNSIYGKLSYDEGVPVKDYADTDGMETVEAWDCAEGCPVAELDRQSGVLTSGANPARRHSDKTRDAYGEFKGQAECTVYRGADSGGASRFFPVFNYVAKAPSSERPRLADGTAWSTVKPLGFMRWAVRLITPQGGGTCLDPFAGTFTTAEACIVEGFPCIAIDRDEKAVQLGMERLSKPIQPCLFGEAS